jgi:hypothetical protein
MRCQDWSAGHVVGMWLIAASVLAGAGCQTLDPNLVSLFTEGSDAAAVAATPATKDAGEQYYVEFRPDGGKPTVVAKPLNDVTFVQQALEQSGAIKRFPRIKVDVYRQLPEGGGHRIPISYDRRNRRVAAGTDYAIHPRDRIVVTEDTSTVLDDMLETLGMPAGTLRKG